MRERNVKIYVASKMKHADAVKAVQLHKVGLTFTNRWHFMETVIPETADHAANFWENDFDDIDAADAVVVYGEPGDHLRGALIEAGYGIARGKPVFLCGETDSFGTWQHSPRVENSTIGLPLDRAIDCAWRAVLGARRTPTPAHPAHSKPGSGGGE